MMTRLKACPFCGLLDDHTDTCYLTLKAAGAMSGEQLAAWNRRPAPYPITTTKTCTCPSGDGSLRWPCPQHPPEDRRTAPEDRQLPHYDDIAIDHFAGAMKGRPEAERRAAAVGMTLFCAQLKLCKPCCSST